MVTHPTLLAQLRQRTIDTTTTTTVEVLRNAPQSDGAGGVTASWRVIATDVPGRLNHTSGDQGESRQAVDTSTEWVWTLPVGTDVLPSDQLRSGGVIYEVIGTDAGRSGALTLQVRANASGGGM
jgi:hypothetical protein